MRGRQVQDQHRSELERYHALRWADRKVGAKMHGVAAECTSREPNLVKQ